VGGEFKSPARFPDTVVMSSHGQKRPAEDPLEDSDEQDLFTHTTPTFPPPGAVPGANGCAPQSRALALCTPETSQHSCFAQVDLINQVRMIRSCWAAKLREVRPTANALLALVALHSNLPHNLATIIHTFVYTIGAIGLGSPAPAGIQPPLGSELEGLDLHRMLPEAAGPPKAQAPNTLAAGTDVFCSTLEMGRVSGVVFTFRASFPRVCAASDAAVAAPTAARRGRPKKVTIVSPQLEEPTTVREAGPSGDVLPLEVAHVQLIVVYITDSLSLSRSTAGTAST